MDLESEYQLSLKNMRDWYSIKQTQVEKGRIIGKEEERERIANKMLSSGMSLEEVSRFTGLSIQEIKSIANKK